MQALNRRRFFQQAGAAAGVAASGSLVGARVQGANDRIGVGFIGFGIRGPFLLRAVEKVAGAEVRACCDLYDGRLQGIREIGYPSIQLTRAYEEVLANKDVDVVIVATPDHWHKRIALDSMEAGKDLYVEKPLTYRWEDGAVLAKAVRTSGRILQVGSQQASNPVNAKAIELISSGALGRVTYIRGAILRNTPTGAWYYPIPLDASEETIDWKRFIGDSKWYDFDPNRFFRWRLYWEYSGGLPTDLFVHLITLTHSLMGSRMPRRVTAAGGVLQWQDREVPDHLSAVAEYDGYILELTSSANSVHRVPFLTVMGTEGALEFNDMGTALTYYREPVRESYWYSTLGWPEKARLAFYEANNIDPQTHRPRNTPEGGKPETFNVAGDHLELHMKAFFEAVRTRRQPFEDVEFGSLAATVGHMVNLSYRSGKPAFWDQAQQAVRV